MKFLEFTLLPGKTLFIPAFWWYSIKFNKNTSISCFRYRSYMNNFAIAPYIGMYALQIQNVKRNTSKKHSINELNTKPIEDNIVVEERNADSDSTSNIDMLPIDETIKITDPLSF